MKLSECEPGVLYWCWCASAGSLVVAKRGERLLMGRFEMIHSTCDGLDELNVIDHRHGDENLIPIAPCVPAAEVFEEIATLRIQHTTKSLGGDVPPIC